jgi:RNA polymerase sigma-70 factor (ECF subfamily)
MKQLSEAARRAAAGAAGMRLYARQWLDAEQAEDAVQQALVSLLSQKACPDDPIAWMYVAVRNLAIDISRSRRRRRQREERCARREWFEPSVESALDLRAAQEALARLPLELREIVLLRIWGELGYVQVARIAQVSVGTAHQRFEEAMKQLRELLQ